MPAEKDKDRIIARVKQLLAGAGTKGVSLALNGYRFDDDWLYLVVIPTQPGERASQHAHLMTEIERKLRSDGFAQVLLVPAVPEHSGLDDVPEGKGGPAAA